MGYKQVPYDCLERFAVWGDVRGIDRRHNDTSGRFLGGVAAIAPDYTYD